MKKLIQLIHIIIYSLLPVSMTAQVGIGTISPGPSLLLDIDGNNTRGALLPRFTIPNLFLPNPVVSPKTDLIAVNSYSQSVPAESTVDTRGLTYWDGTKWKLIQNADQLKITNTSSGGGQDMSGLVIHYVNTTPRTFPAAVAPSTTLSDIRSIINKMPELTDPSSPTSNPTANWNSGYINTYERSIVQPMNPLPGNYGAGFRVIQISNPNAVYEVTYKWEGTVSNGQSVTAKIGYNIGALAPTAPWTIMRETTAFAVNNTVSLKITWRGELRNSSEIASGLQFGTTTGYKYNQTYEELIVRKIGEAQ